MQPSGTAASYLQACTEKGAKVIAAEGGAEEEINDWFFEVPHRHAYLTAKNDAKAHSTLMRKHHLQSFLRLCVLFMNTCVHASVRVCVCECQAHAPTSAAVN